MLSAHGQESEQRQAAHFLFRAPPPRLPTRKSPQKICPACPTLGGHLFTLVESLSQQLSPPAIPGCGQPFRVIRSTASGFTSPVFLFFPAQSFSRSASPCSRCSLLRQLAYSCPRAPCALRPKSSLAQGTSPAVFFSPSPPCRSQFFFFRCPRRACLIGSFESLSFFGPSSLTVGRCYCGDLAPLFTLWLRSAPHTFAPLSVSAFTPDLGVFLFPDFFLSKSPRQARFPLRLVFSAQLQPPNSWVKRSCLPSLLTLAFGLISHSHGTQQNFSFSSRINLLSSPRPFFLRWECVVSSLSLLAFS